MLHISTTKVFVRYKSVSYLTKTFVVEMLYLKQHGRNE